MKEISVREARKIIGKLDQVLDKEGELKITNHGKPIAIVTPVKQSKRMPSHKNLRESMIPMKISSQDLVRSDRDTR